MRIQTEERIVIRKVLHTHFGNQARIFLFGSRTNDQTRGGDIDLLVETYQCDDIFTRKLKALSELQIALGDQKIDLLIKTPGMSAPVPLVYSEDFATGVEL